MNLIGDCRNEELVKELFGSVTDFAYEIENRGDNFTFGKIKVKYNKNTDIHSFYES